MKTVKTTKPLRMTQKQKQNIVIKTNCKRVQIEITNKNIFKQR